MNQYQKEYKDLFQQNHDVINWSDKYKTISRDLDRNAGAIAKVTGFSVQTISDITHGKKKPSFSLVSDTARYLHVNPDWLLDPDSKEPVLTDNLRKRDTGDHIAQRMRILMDGRSEKTFARQAHINIDTLHALLNGEKVIEAVFERLADICDVGFEWLLSGDENAKNNPCNMVMIHWLKRHPDERQEIFMEMPEKVEKQSIVVWNMLERAEIYDAALRNEADLAAMGKRIQAVRHAYGYSLRDFSSVTGVSKSTINYWENGKHEPDEFALRRISESLNISADWVLYGDRLSMRWPCDGRMIEFLKSRADVRKKVFLNMNI